MKSGEKILTIFIIFVLWINSVSCNTSDKKNEPPDYKGKANIEFPDTLHDFGILEEGEVAEYTFKYKNTGTAPLKITNIITDCGCTVPKYDKKPVLPGENAKIKVTFDSRGFRNNIYKTITVKTNAEKRNIKLILTAFIKNNNNLNY